MKTHEMPFELITERKKLDPVDKAYISAQALDRLFVELNGCLRVALEQALYKGVLIRKVKIIGKIEIS